MSATNSAPEWTPGMPRPDGMAAHPSMQRKDSETIQRLLAAACEDRAMALRTFPDSPDRDNYIGQCDELIAAYSLALRWRNG